MGFSVDYVVSGNLPASTGQVAWVIESGAGNDVTIPIRLDRRGNLMTVVPRMKPGRGPFLCYLAIVSARGQSMPISRKVTMRSP